MLDRVSPETIKELLQTEARLRWETHGIMHVSLSTALDLAKTVTARETELRWGAHRDQHEALDHAEEQYRLAIYSKLESMNEFRAQLVQQAGTFVTREMVAEKEASHMTMHEHTRGRISDLEQWRAAVDAKFWALGIGFTIFTFALNIITRYLFPHVP